MIVCQHCGTKNNDNFNCCYNCGTPLPKKKSVPFADEEKKPNIMPGSHSYDTDDEVVSDDEFENEPTLNDEMFENEQNVDFDENEGDNDEEFYSEPEETEETASYSSAAYEEDVKGRTVISTKSQYSKNKKSGKKSKYEVNLSKLVQILALVFIALIIIWGMGKLLDHIFESTPGVTPSPTAPSLQQSNFNTDDNYIISFDDNGNKVFNISIQTSGDTVSVLNKVYTVENGMTAISISELDVYKNYRPSNIQVGQTFDTNIPIIVSKEGYEDYKYEVELQGISTPSVPYTLVSLKSEKTDIYKNNTVISFVTERNSRVYINGTDYTEEYFNASTGVFSITIVTPIAEGTYKYNVRIESDDYMTREIEFELSRKQLWEDPDLAPEISVDKYIWETNDESLVTITGTFKGNPDDLAFVEKYSSAAVELVSLNVSDDDRGSFEAVIKSNKLGWAEVSVECKTNLDYATTVYIKCLSKELGGYSKFTTSSKDVLTNYSALGGNNAYKGDRFVTYGSNYAIITSVEKTELGYAFYATLNNGTEDQLIYVETFMDAFTFEAGRKVTIFGNLYGNKDGVPRIIAVSVTAK